MSARKSLMRRILDRDAPAAGADFEGRFSDLEAAVRALQGRAG